MPPDTRHDLLGCSFHKVDGLAVAFHDRILLRVPSRGESQHTLVKHDGFLHVGDRQHGAYFFRYCRSVHSASPCSVFAFRVNFYVSHAVKILTLADRLAVPRIVGRAGNRTSMKIHEYQAKAILSRYVVTTPRGEVAFTKEQAREAAHRLRSHVTVVVVKAQIHAGGRGKAGGVKLARSSDEAADIASHILGVKLVTPQTGPGGRIVKRLLIERGLDIKRHLYLGLLVDRATARLLFMATAARC